MLYPVHLKVMQMGGAINPQLLSKVLRDVGFPSWITGLGSSMINLNVAVRRQLSFSPATRGGAEQSHWPVVYCAGFGALHGDYGDEGWGV